MSQNKRTEDGFDEAALDALFAEARAVEPDPLPEAIAARLLAGAEAAIPRPVRRGWLARVRDALAEIGGAPGLAGVGVAGLAGVWIGFSGPGMTGVLVNQFWQGAASVSGSVSALVAGDPISAPADDLLSLMSTSE
jgi:hypothetical protein